MFAFGVVTLGLGLATHPSEDNTELMAYTHFQLEAFHVPLKPTNNADTLQMTIELEIQDHHVEHLYSPGVMAALRSGIIA